MYLLYTCLVHNCVLELNNIVESSMSLLQAIVLNQLQMNVNALLFGL